MGVPASAAWRGGAAAFRPAPAPVVPLWRGPGKPFKMPPLPPPARRGAGYMRWMRRAKFLAPLVAGATAYEIYKRVTAPKGEEWGYVLGPGWVQNCNLGAPNGLYGPYQGGLGICGFGYFNAGHDFGDPFDPSPYGLTAPVPNSDNMHWVGQGDPLNPLVSPEIYTVRLGFHHNSVPTTAPQLAVNLAELPGPNTPTPSEVGQPDPWEAPWARPFPRRVRFGQPNPTPIPWAPPAPGGSPRPSPRPRPRPDPRPKPDAPSLRVRLDPKVRERLRDRRPRRKTRERKYLASRSLARVVALAQSVTEMFDLFAALYDALPEALRKEIWRQEGGRGPLAREKIGYVLNNLDKLVLEDVLKNVMRETFEDYLWASRGKVDQAMINRVWRETGIDLRGALLGQRAMEREIFREEYGYERMGGPLDWWLGA